MAITQLLVGNHCLPVAQICDRDRLSLFRSPQGTSQSAHLPAGAAPVGQHFCIRYGEVLDLIRFLYESKNKLSGSGGRIAVNDVV